MLVKNKKINEIDVWIKPLFNQKLIFGKYIPIEEYTNRGQKGVISLKKGIKFQTKLKNDLKRNKKPFIKALKNYKEKGIIDWDENLNPLKDIIHVTILNDYSSFSPSGIASLILGTSINGYLNWKDKNGYILDKNRKNYKLTIENMSIKDLKFFLKEKNINFIKNNNYYIKQNKDVQKSRNIFVNNLEKEFIDLKVKHAISEYAKSFDLENKMNLTDKAHIIPVWYLIKNERYDDIKDSNNGLILDPNTHRIFDQDKNVKISKDYSTISNNHISFNINKIFLNKERIKFLEEWKILKKTKEI